MSVSIGAMSITGISGPFAGHGLSALGNMEYSVCLATESLGVVMWVDATRAGSDYDWPTAQVFTIVGGVPTLVGAPVHVYLDMASWAWRGITRVDDTHVMFIAEGWAGGHGTVNTPGYAQVLEILPTGTINLGPSSALPAGAVTGGAARSLSGGRLAYTSSSGSTSYPNIQVDVATGTPTGITWTTNVYARAAYTTDPTQVGIGDGISHALIGGGLPYDVAHPYRLRQRLAQGNLLDWSGGSLVQSTAPANVPDTADGYFFETPTETGSGGMSVSPGAGLFFGHVWPNLDYNAGDLVFSVFDTNLTVVQAVLTVPGYANASFDPPDYQAVAVNGCVDVVSLPGGRSTTGLRIGSTDFPTTVPWDTLTAVRAQRNSVGAMVGVESWNGGAGGQLYLIAYSGGTTPNLTATVSASRVRFRRAR